MLLLVAARYLEEREHRPAVAELLAAIDRAAARTAGRGAAADGARAAGVAGAAGAPGVAGAPGAPGAAGAAGAPGAAERPVDRSGGSLPGEAARAAVTSGGSVTVRRRPFAAPAGDAARRVLATGERLAAPPGAPPGTRVALGRNTEDAVPLLVVVRPADARTDAAAGGTDGDLWIAHREAPAVAAALDAVRRTTLVAVPLAALAVAVTTWFVAGIAVGPIRALRLAAERIRPESVDRPIDVTDDDAPQEIRRLESALNDALARVDAGYRAQERFLLNVSHELKTPISVVLTDVQVRLARPGVASDERRILEQTAEEMRRLGDLVESFLLLARVRHGDAPRRRSAVGLDELAAETADGCTPMADQAGIELAIELDEAAADGATVTGDLELLRTMLENLVRNAVRFSPAGGTVRISAAVDGATARLAVADDGPGIPESLLPSLFDRFSQAEDERRTARGSGLGLSIAAGVAELHGGSISAENRAQGCRLTVRLPLAADEPDDARSRDGSAGEPGGDPGGEPGDRDDEPEHLRDRDVPGTADEPSAATDAVDDLRAPREARAGGSLGSMHAHEGKFTRDSD